MFRDVLVTIGKIMGFVRLAGWMSKERLFAYLARG